MLSVDLARALELFAQPKGKGRGRAAPIRVVGEHPETKSPVELYDGPYGLYIKHEKTNATLPKEIKPEDLSMEQALKLLAEKEALNPRASKTKAKKAEKPAKKAKAKK